MRVLRTVLFSLLTGGLLLACGGAHPKPATPDVTCEVHAAYPDSHCTPGAVFPSATAAIVCKSGYTATVRNVSQAMKNKVFAEYRITSKAGQYEVDHFIPLELGGSNDLNNLWPEAALPRPGFHEKDQVENYLHSQVCTGEMTLQQAQSAIASDWIKVYRAHFS